MDNLGYLFAANAFVWSGIFAYVFCLVRRSRSLQKDLDLLKESLKKEPDRE